jgi:hypothetical protein
MVESDIVLLYIRSRVWGIIYALVDTKSHASKISKVTMSKLLGGVISESVLILLNLDFDIDRS